MSLLVKNHDRSSNNLNYLAKLGHCCAPFMF